ncbi:YkvA family protein [Plantactinospora sp. B5E13]|uniref:YkvA family protein n=1 Tax=unclassified Plantactinospora TaxID=2631981 RepID=UPI00325F3371
MAKTLRRTAAFKALFHALSAGSRGGPSLGRRLGALPRMVRATLRGEYDGGLRLAMMTAATAYVVSPIDAMPELMMLLFGLADDALLVTWLAGAVLAETERFLVWEARRESVVPGHVVG